LTVAGDIGASKICNPPFAARLIDQRPSQEWDHAHWSPVTKIVGAGVMTGEAFTMPKRRLYRGERAVWKLSEPHLHLPCAHQI
jgi:hypothetical protein